MSLLLAVKVNSSGLSPQAAAAELDEHKDFPDFQQFREEIDRRSAQYRPGEPKAMLYRLSETGGISSTNDDIIVTGTDAAETLMREMAKLLFASHAISVFGMRHLAAHMIHRVVRFASYCGGRAQLACLADVGASYFDNDPSADAGPDWIAQILLDIPEIIASCLDGQQQPFEDTTKRCMERLREALEGREKALRQHHPLETERWAW